MKRKRVLGLSIALLVLLILMAGVTTIRAQNPAGLSIGLQINPDGSWQIVEFFGQKTNLTPESFNSMAQVLGLGFEIPARLVDPTVVSMLRRGGIDQLTLSLEGEAARVRLNDMAMPQAKVHLEGLNVFLGDVSESYSVLVGIVKFIQGTVYVRFTPEAITPAPPAEAAMMEEAANNLHLAATVNRQGQVLSAGGFTRQDVDPLLNAAGMVIPDLDPSVMAYLAAFDSVTVDVAPSAMMLHADEAPILEVVWDAEGRMATLDLVENFAGLALDRQMVDMVEPWLETTHANVMLHIADAPQDDLLAVDIGEPITVALNEGGMVNVAGMDIPVAGLDTGMLRSTVGAYGVEQAQVCWQGTELRWLVNGKQMPYISADPGWMTETVNLLGWQTFAIHEKLEQLLAETELPLSVALDPAAVPAGDCGAYAVTEAPEPTLAFAVEGTWNRQQSELALDNVDLPFERLGMLPIGISAQFRLPPEAAVFVPSTLTSAEANVGPEGISTTLDNVDVAIHWDSELLANLAEVADGFGFGNVVRQVVPILSATGISIDLESMTSMKEAAESSQARLEEATPAVAVEAPATSGTEQPAPAAERPESAAEQPAPVPEQDTTETKIVAEEAEQSETARANGICVITKGDSLWTCWVNFGRSEGTGKVWVDWKEAIMIAYDLTASKEKEDVVIVQPGDTIDVRASTN